MPIAPVIRVVQEELTRRFVSRGGVAEQPGADFRADATAWSILVLAAAEAAATLLEMHRARLVTEQDSSGRVTIDRDHPDSYWPTSLAILAWHGSSASRAAQLRASEFLLGSSGVHFARKPDAPWAHDTVLRGWPWINETHSWVEPTAMCVMALRMAGHAEHMRVREAVMMLLDRQLPHGGWNYGNTLMFGRELHPMPETTGAALTGLVGLVPRERVNRSIDYLEGEVDRLRTPLSLGWALLGLAAWRRFPSNVAGLVERCLTRQSRYGVYDTSALCVLALGALAQEDDRTTLPLLQPSIH